ncbi:CHAT domain-containing protein [Streptomyces sp. NPDC051183]|uniref:CHAT domain-containing protein n=1 Tax=Streptomyces sp. NPDC051183 TaxID=3155165 RepID=UPI00344715A9
MSREESGGVEGLRAWVSDAVERVKRLLPGLRTAGPLAPPRAYEASVTELEQLAGLLDHDERLRGSVNVWLAGALTLRHATGGGRAADRERAEALLRAARDRTTPLGAVVTEEERRWAALFLIGHVSPIQPQEGYGGAPDLSGYLDWLTRSQPAEMLTAATEIQELINDMAQLSLPIEVMGQLRQVQDTLAAPSLQGLSEMMAGMVPGGSPIADQYRQMMDQVFARAGGFGAGRPNGATPPPGPQPQPQPRPKPEPASGPEPDSKPGPEPKPGQGQGSEPDHPEPGPGPESGPDPKPETKTQSEPRPGPGPEPDPEPGSEPGPGLTADGFRNMVRAMDAVNAATQGLDPVLRSGDPEALNGLLRKLRSAQDLPLPDPGQTSALEGMRALLLGISPAVGGTRQDMSAGRAHMGSIIAHLEAISGSLPKSLGDPAALGRAMDIGSRAMEAREAQDVPAIRALVEEAEALAATVPESDPLRFAVDGALGAAYGALGITTRDRETLLRTMALMEQTMNRAKESGLPFADELSLPGMGDFAIIRAALAGEPMSSVGDHVPPPPDASMEELHASTLSLVVRVGLDRDPAVLDVLIGELERLRDGVREGRAPRIAADALWHLAEAYELRGRLGKDTSDPADSGALEAAEEALTALAADVLLQAGAEHGLLAARTGASRGVRAARIAASYGKLHEAVAALELGRALVLQAASTSSAVPELLDAAGHQDLAEAWRKAAGAARGAGGTEGDGRGPDGAGEVPGLLPSTLRRQALDALGYRRDGGLLGTPTPSELADGLGDAGADVLLYLVAGDDAGPGLVIAVGPQLGMGAGALPQLCDDEDGPLARYVEAAAARDRDHGDAAVARAWEEALEELCDWAFQALGPVLTGIEERLAAAGEGPGREYGDRPLRVVLVPCGRLGIVPWHAARLPAEAAHERLCQVAVISYAASGGQFLRTAGRAPRDPVAAPVLVADPTMSLGFSDTEVTALRDAFYPHAQLCGALYGEELPPGTPEAVLGFLADGVSLLHVVSHGSAGTRPTVSALDLAADEKCTPAPLTVTRLLDRKGQQEGAEGPLVVLSACQTDLSRGDHDEALTLTTAFAAAGARDVVGSRWLAQDSASALLMAVFHHHLVVDGFSPVDALRAAQLWMLDPGRENPGSLQGDLLREMGRPGLERTALWAAFIHQGHPGPGATKTAEGTA